MSQVLEHNLRFTFITSGLTFKLCNQQPLPEQLSPSFRHSLFAPTLTPAESHLGFSKWMWTRRQGDKFYLMIIATIPCLPLYINSNGIENKAQPAWDLFPVTNINLLYSHGPMRVCICMYMTWTLLSNVDHIIFILTPPNLSSILG